MFHQVLAALGTSFEPMATTDTTSAGGTLNLGVEFPLIRVDGTGGVTKVLPDSGFFCLVTNSATSGDIQLDDLGGETIVTAITPLETALCIRIGGAGAIADQRWQAVILKVDAT